MDVLLQYLQDYQILIYVVLGIGGIIVLRNVLKAWREWRNAFFGLERESARQKASSSMTILLTIMILAVAEFFLVSFYLPNQPKELALATPTIDLLATPTVTLPSGTKMATTPTRVDGTTTSVVEEGCTPGKIQWVFPQNGGQLKGTVELKGIVNVPNLGFYKYEFSSVGSNTWVTIAAGNSESYKLADQKLGGAWNTAQLVPGDYRLRLVVSDNQNQIFPACVITIRIVAP